MRATYSSRSRPRLPDAILDPLRRGLSRRNRLDENVERSIILLMNSRTLVNFRPIHNFVSGRSADCDLFFGVTRELVSS